MSVTSKEYIQYSVGNTYNTINIFQTELSFSPQFFLVSLKKIAS